MSRGNVRFGWSWFDLSLYFLAVVLLIPLVMRVVESVLEALE